MRQVWILSVLLFLLIIGIITPRVEGNIERSGVVSWITDGDTFDINYVTYRMADIDAPETYEDYEAYNESKYYLLDLIHGKTVYLDIDDKYTYDIYDRFVCVVYVSHNTTHYLNVNKAMVVANHAITKNYDNEFNPYTWSLFVLKPSTSPTPTLSPPSTPRSYPTPTGGPELFPTAVAVISIISVVVGIAINSYMKKYKK